MPRDRRDLRPRASRARRRRCGAPRVHGTTVALPATLKDATRPEGVGDGSDGPGKRPLLWNICPGKHSIARAEPFAPTGTLARAVLGAPPAHARGSRSSSRVALLGAAIVLADASLIEPIAVRAGLWRWTEPGLFAVPLVGIVGWAFFAWAAAFASGGVQNSGSRAMNSFAG